MKKLFVILGNATFENKLVKELSSCYQHVGSSNRVDQSVLDEIIDKEVDVIVVRESLAEHQQAFSDFINGLFKNNTHKIKVIAITQNHPVGDDSLYQLVSCGVYDIINNGTRLTELIEYSVRDSNVYNALHLLSENQALSLTQPKQNTSMSTETGDASSEDIIINIDGELSIENNPFLVDIKERYLNGITQTHSPFMSDIEIGSEQIQLTDNHRAKQWESFKKDAGVGSPEGKKITENINCATTMLPLETVSSRAKIIIHCVVHCLASSVAIQCAVDLSRSKRVAYVETQHRNVVLLPALERSGVQSHYIETIDKATGWTNEHIHQFDFIIINLHGVHTLWDSSPDIMNIEILQDKEMMNECHKMLSNYATAKLIVAYFEQNLSSIKSLNKGFGRRFVRWDNSRLEEHNSRLNAFILANTAVKEVNKGVL